MESTNFLLADSKTKSIDFSQLNPFSDQVTKNYGFCSDHYGSYSLPL